MLKTIKDFELKGKRVFIRVDFNVPLEGDKIVDDTRILASLPTINYAVQSQAKVIICSHLGRPKGKKVPEYSLKPVYEYLKKFLKTRVEFLEEISDEALSHACKELKEGEVLLLENVRFYPGETRNDPEFAAVLGKNVDVFINDAFSVSHRAHASVVGVPALVKEKGIGFQMEKELKYLSKVVSKPERPFFAVVGGSKVSTKIGVLKNLISKLDKLIIGGAMANTFLAAQGYPVGASFVEREYIEVAKKVIKEGREEGVKIYLPVDVVVEREGSVEEVGIKDVREKDVIYDIGSRSVEFFSDAISGAKTVVWNGPLGYFEKAPFHRGTVFIARKIAALNATTVAGGGDTLAAIKLAAVESAFSYVSTAGGAFLEYLEGKELPGIAVLKS